jgi:dephospho-CoA kinase
LNRPEERKRAESVGLVGDSRENGCDNPEAARRPGRKPVIGLAGGIGSGKSTVASILADLGAAVISSDHLNHEEMKRPEVLRELQGRFGDTIVQANGTADRAALRRIVTADPEARKWLESLLHPRIERRRLELMKACEADPTVGAIILDSPLLYEAALDRQCDCVIFVDADEGARINRVRQRGWSDSDLRAFEKTQKPLDFKRASADYRVENNSDIGALRQCVEGVFSRILSGA